MTWFRPYKYKQKALDILIRLEQWGKVFWALVGFILIGCIGWLDLVTGYELAFSLFYLLPILLLTWLGNRHLGLIAALVSALVWLAADLGAGHAYLHPLVPIWNALIGFSFFIIFILLSSEVKRLLAYERNLARTDYLTGAVNLRCFTELVRMEMDRFQRYEHPFTVVYIDLDNFKVVNDEFGHAAGDQVLRTIVNCANQHLRRIDVVARLGGDEFALLLPETNEKSAQVALTHMQRVFLTEMQNCNWPITLSVGALTCMATTPPTIAELLKITDELMYTAKESGKNTIKSAVYTQSE